MYDFELHKINGEKTSFAADTILGILDPFLTLDSVLDVGCGDGRWLAACQNHGATTIAGVDGPWTDLQQLSFPAENITIHDLATSFDLNRKFDLAISLEVAEHLPPEAAETMVENLVRHSDVILFSAAIPHQGGFRHINEQWQSYWAQLFDLRGFAPFDPIRAQIWDNPKISFWYKQNILLYINGAATETIASLSRHIAAQNIQQLPLDIVHPERFLLVASYEDIDFKPLTQKLPRQLYRNMKNFILPDRKPQRRPAA